MRKYTYYFSLLLVAIIISVGVQLYAVSGIDFVDGTKIPTTLTADRTHSGANTFSGATTLSGTTTISGAATLTAPTANGLKVGAVHTNSTTLALTSAHDVIVVDSGTAETINLPATPIAGKAYTIIHNNGTVATTVVALGASSGFSLNGAASNNTLDAAGNSMFIIGTANGWYAGVNN